MNRDNDEQIVARTATLLRDWLHDKGGSRVECDVVGIGLTEQWLVWLTVDGERRSVHFPRELGFATSRLRDAQAVEGRGAWTCAHLWMDADEGVLHGEFDWMREPMFHHPDGDRPPGPYDSVIELRRHPRDPEFIPEWMAKGVAAHEKREAANARRRERRRAKKAALAAQTAQQEAQEPDSPDAAGSLAADGRTDNNRREENTP